MSIKQSFINANRKSKAIEIEEIGETVYISKWSAKQRAIIIPGISGFEEAETNAQKYEEMIRGMARIVQVSLLDSSNARVFDDSQEDLEILLDFEGDVIQHLFNEILDYNGLGESNVKEAAKN
jgi:hypothetical protein